MRLQDIPAETPLFHSAGLKIFDQHVGLRDEPLQDFGTLRFPKIEGRRLLVAGFLQKQKAITVSL